jgi:hypothetical protein
VTPSSRFRPLLVPIAAALFLVTTALGSSGGAVADVAPRQGDLGRRAPVVEPMTIVAQDFEIPVDDVLDITVGLPTGYDSATLGQDGTPAEVVVGIYRDTSTRDEVRAAAAGQLGRVGDTYTLSLDAAVADPRVGRPAADQLSLAVPTESATRTPDALQVPLPGIYPIVVDLRVGDEIVAEAITFVHRTAEDAATQPELSVGFLFGQTIEPTIDIDGNVVPTAAELDKLGHLADLLTALDGVPATLGTDVVPPRGVRIQPSVFAALSEADPDLAARLTPLLERSELTALTKLPFDPSTAMRNDEQELYTRWLREGEDVLLASLPRAQVDRTTYLVAETTSTEAALMRRRLGTRMLVLTPEIYESTPGNISFAYTDTTQLVTVDLGDGTSMPAAVIDGKFAEDLDEPTADPLGTAVGMAAELLALTEQFQASGLDVANHGMMIGRSDVGVPDPAVIANLMTLLLDTTGVDVVTPSTLSSIVTNLLVDGREITLEFPDTAGDDLSERQTTISDIRIESLGVASMLPDGDPTVTAWAQTLEALPSTALSDAEVDAMVAALRDRLDVYRNGVVPPEPFSFTLTGRESSIPIGVGNLTDTPLKVKIRMSSAKLTFPEGDLIVELAPQQTTEFRVPVEARSNGRSGVALDILTPATDAQLVPTVTLTARVNALTGLGQLVTGAALLVLATWWIRHWRMNRRRRIAADGHHRHPAAVGRPPGEQVGNDDDLAPDAAASSLPPS